MKMSTNLNTELKALQTVVDEWQTKIENDKSLFWKSLANSYYNLEINSINEQKFISTISFYPDLIQHLIDSICLESETKLEIIFFSTLLPRHFWNFPIIKHLRDETFIIDF